MEPFARAGYYKQDRTTYLECRPSVACVGGNDTSRQCKAGYTGIACSSCARVRTRRGGRGRGCLHVSPQRVVVWRPGHLLAAAWRAGCRDGARVGFVLSYSSLPCCPPPPSFLSPQHVFAYTRQPPHRLFLVRALLVGFAAPLEHTPLTQTPPLLFQQFYRLDVYCKPCPNLAWLLIVGFVIIVCLLLLVGIWLNQRRINLAALGIGVDFAQVREAGCCATRLCLCVSRSTARHRKGR
jgi:hypothetical protein